MTHEEFLQAIAGVKRGLAPALGWKCQWHHRSYHSPAGFPDLFMVHEETKRAIVAELKVRDKRGRMDDLSAEQYEWLALLQEAGIETYLWTSDDPIEEIAEVLQGGEA